MNASSDESGRGNVGESADAPGPSGAAWLAPAAKPAESNAQSRGAANRKRSSRLGNGRGMEESMGEKKVEKGARASGYVLSFSGRRKR